MDAMALLCNLHADGPISLRRLREGGCASLEELLDRAPEELAKLLVSTPAVARRFLREGSSLLERLGGEMLEREDQSAVPVAAAVAATARTGSLPVREREILVQVMQRWKDEEAAESDEPIAVAEAPLPAAVSVDPFAEVELDGLDTETRDRLREAGVQGLEELIQSPLEAIDQRTKLGYSRLRRLQFLARRQLEREVDIPRPLPNPAQASPNPAQASQGELPTPEPVEEKISLAFPARPMLSPEPRTLSETEQRGGPFA